MKLLAGNSNRPLAQGIADHLDLPLTRAQVRDLVSQFKLHPSLGSDDADAHDHSHDGHE